MKLHSINKKKDDIDKDDCRYWLNAIAKGDTSAETALCCYFNGRFKGIFLAQGFNLYAYEDACQDALISLINALRLGRIKNELSIESYFYTSIKYQLWSQYKRGRKTVSLEDHTSSVEPCNIANCLEQVSYQQELEQVIHSIKQLKIQRDKEVLIRFFFKEDEINTICRELNLCRDHFYRVLHRAKLRLKNVM